MKKPDATKSVKKLIVEAATAGEEIQEIRGLFVEGLRVDTQHVGTRIKKLRETMRLSQDDIASNTGLSQSYISRIEKGEAAPSKEVLGRIAVPLKTTLTALVEGTHSVDALEEPTFAERHAYCPNIDCPGTAYGFWDDSILAWRTLTTEEFYKGEFGGGETLAEFRMREDLPPAAGLYHPVELIYRWIKLDEDTNFCELCGTKLRNSCLNCNTPLKAWNQKFCHSCGFQLNKLPEHEKGGEE